MKGSQSPTTKRFRHPPTPQPTESVAVNPTLLGDRVFVGVK
jgi:hypothetical protein